MNSKARTEGAVLIVEDDDSVRLSLRDFLQKKGLQVLVASDGVGSIKLLIDKTVSAIITDYRMSILGGDYWIRFLGRFCSDIPVLVISGFLQPNFDIPFPVITKPFDYDEMYGRIIEILSP